MKRSHVLTAVLSLVVVSGYLLLSVKASSLDTTSTTTVIRIWDACDPASFDKAVGPGACLPARHGTETFGLFLNELTLDQHAGAWRFGSPAYTLASGQPTVLKNRGGETHTFTKVAAFGGGFVPFLNQLSGNPVPAPECLQPPSSTSLFVPGAGGNHRGPTAGSADLPVGTTNFQCCIHPWMRTTITVQ